MKASGVEETRAGLRDAKRPRHSDSSLAPWIGSRTIWAKGGKAAARLVRGCMGQASWGSKGVNPLLKALKITKRESKAEALNAWNDTGGTADVFLASSIALRCDLRQALGLCTPSQDTELKGYLPPAPGSLRAQDTHSC